MWWQPNCSCNVRDCITHLIHSPILMHELIDTMTLSLTESTSQFYSVLLLAMAGPCSINVIFLCHLYSICKKSTLILLKSLSSLYLGASGWVEWLPGKWEGRGDPMSADAQQQLRESHGGWWEWWLRHQSQSVASKSCPSRCPRS